MFASIEDFSIIKNMNIGLIGVSASNIQHVGTIAGAIENSKIVNIKIYAQDTSSTALVLGQNVVGGVVGLVSGDSSVVSLSTTNISVTADYYNESSNNKRQFYTRQDKLTKQNNSAISYAGGIVGILDIYSSELFTSFDYSQDKLMSFAQSSSLKVSGKTQVRGGTVGGVLGFVGINTSVRNAEFEITQVNGVYSQKIISYKYVAGGVIGESYGDVTQSKIEHSYDAQMAIEANLSNYYNTTATVSRGYEELFTSDSGYSPLFVGGLIGQIFSGKISNSYAKVNVISSNANSSNIQYIGGIAGAVGDYYYQSTSKIGITTFEEVYAFGSLKILNNTNSSSGCGGIVGFIEYVNEGKMNSSNVEVSVTFDGVNAVTYFDKTFAENEIDNLSETQKIMKYVYDFYAYTYYENAHVNSTLFDKKLFTLSNLLNSSEPVNYVMSDLVLNNITYSPKRSQYINQTNEGTSLSSFTNRIISLREIANVANDSSYMDVVFRNNSWDQEKWERKENELLPGIVFTVSTSIYYIRVASDFNLMAKHPDKTFIIIGSGENGTNRVLVDMSTITDSTSTLEAIKNFRGVLKGYMPKTLLQSDRTEPLFGIKNLNNRTKALIESATNGAIFTDFLIVNSGNMDLADGSLLIGSSSGVVFRNIIIENIRIGSSKENIAILTSTAKNCMFDTIDIIQNITSEMVTANLKSTTQQNVNVGLLAGYVESTKRTTFKEITIQMNSSTTLKNYGIFVSSATPLNDNVLRTVNIGGYFGLASGRVEISSAIAQTFIKNLGIQFNGWDQSEDYFIVNAGAICGVVNDVYVDLTSENLSRNTLVSFDISGQFKSSSSISPSLAIGGLFGKTTSSLKVSGYENKTNIIPKIKITNSYLVTQSDIESTEQPSIYIGGIAGHTDGSVSVEYVYIQNKLADNNINSLTSNINIDALNNSIFASAMIGFASGQFSIDNTVVNSAFYANINNTLQEDIVLNNSVDSYFGDALAYFSDSSDKSSLSITNTYFFGRYEISNTPNITYGGILGATVRTGATSGENRIIENNATGGILTINRVANSIITAGGIIGNSNKSGVEPSKSLSISNNIPCGDINLVAVAMSNQDKIFMGGIAGIGDTKLEVTQNIILTTLYSTRTTLTSGNYFVSAVVGNSAYYDSIENNFYSSQISLTTQEEAQNLSYQAILNKISATTILTNQFSSLSLTNGIVNANGSKLSPYAFSQISATSGNSYFRKYYSLSDNIAYSTNPITLDGQNGQFNKAVIGDGKNITLTNSAYRLFDIIDSQSFVSGISLKVSNPNYSVLASTALYPSVFSGANYTYADNEENFVSYQMYAPLVAVNEGVIFGSGVSGVNSSTQTEFNNENAQKLYAKFILNKVNLAGGLVALNNGYIADSFTSVEITNLTGKLNDFVSITSGFVGINQGDIASSYSSGVINALYGKTYAFGSDQINSIYIQNGSDGTSFVPSVRNSFTIAQSSKALEEVDETGSVVISYAGVFGQFADNSNFYDIYATQTQSKEGTAEKYITQQISKLQSEDSISVWSTSLEYSNFGYEITNNFGYPSFQRAYSSDTFKFMRQITSNETDYIVSSLGKLQQLSTLLSNSSQKNLYLISDLKITDDMGFVSIRIQSFTSTNIENIGTWDSFELNKTIIYGNDFTISNFSVITNPNAFDVQVEVSGREDKKIVNDKNNNGFFIRLIYSTINNLILADSQVILEENEGNGGRIGAFAGTALASEINNSKNLGVLVQSNELGYVGGIVGLCSVSSSNPISTIIKNTINTGNVLAIWGDKTESLDGFVAYAGGIIGSYTRAEFSNNQNYALVMAEQFENERGKLSYATGIGYNANELPINVTSENNQNNANFGEVRVQKNTVDDNGTPDIDSDDIVVFDSLIDEQAFKLFNKTTPTNYTIPTVDDDYTNLPVNNYNPTLIYNSIDFVKISTNPNSQFLLMNNIEIGQLTELSYVEEFSGTIYGNEKLISYYGYLKSGTDDAKQDDIAFIYELKQDATLSNLKILGVSQNAQNDVSILANNNSGTIYKTNVYGAITGTSTEVNNSENKFISGVVILNEGKIILSSNYALLKGTDGRDAAIENYSQYNIGISANNIGGLVGTTYGSILYSINYGALIGGDGGNGHDGKDGEAGIDSDDNTHSTKGTNATSGTNGGNASTIGGIAVCADRSGSEEITITGTNNGIIIAGKGGDGGNGGNGGNGGDANNGAANAVIAEANAARAVYLGNAIYNPIGGAIALASAIALVYAVNPTYFNDIDSYAGSDGGIGGAGGNGGNAIVADIVGVNKSTDNFIDSINSEPTLYSNVAGIGGKGGNGGDGGRGLKYALDPVSAIFGIYKYTKSGSGGGAGGAGYSGNTFESLINARMDNLIYVASQGGLYDDNNQLVDVTKGGDGSVRGESGINAESLKELISEFANINDEKYLPKGGQGYPSLQNYSYSQTSNGVGINPINLTTDEEGNYLINTWDELKLAIMLNNSTQNPAIKYILQKEFLFGYNGNNSDTQEFVSDNFTSLPSFIGTITGGKISIKGSYNQLNLVKQLNEYSYFENIEIKLNIENYGQKFENDLQFISESYDVFIENLNVEFSGQISSKYTTAQMQILSGNFTSQFDWSYATSSFTDGTGTSGDPFIINSQATWNEFSLLVEMGSTHYFKLTEHISIQPNENDSYYFNDFNAHLSGNNVAEISLGQYNNEGNTYKFDSFIMNNYGAISNIKFSGIFNSSAIANTNEVGAVIDNIGVVGYNGEVISTGRLAGFVIENYGTIQNCINYASLTSTNGSVAGIAISNFGLIKNVSNFGNINAGNGSDAYYDNENNLINAKSGGLAAGITIQNGYNGDSVEDNKGLINVHNTGNITAGNAGTTIGGNGGAVGGDAAGLVLNNINAYVIVEMNEENEVIQTLSIYSGLLSSEQDYTNNNSGIIRAGNGSGGLTGGNAGYFIVYNSVEYEEVLYAGEISGTYLQNGYAYGGTPNGQVYIIVDGQVVVEE